MIRRIHTGAGSARLRIGRYGDSSNQTNNKQPRHIDELPNRQIATNSSRFQERSTLPDAKLTSSALVRERQQTR